MGKYLASLEIGILVYLCCVRAFVKLKKNPKIREKLGKWVGGSSPNSDFSFFWKLCVFCVFYIVVFVVHVSKKNKKLDRGVGVCGMANPSFSRIFGFCLT